MEKAAIDARETVHRLRQFGRPSSDEGFTNVDVGELVNEVVEMTRPWWNEWAKLRGINVRVTKLLSPVPPVHGCASELRQVLVNLVLNAIDALPGGGEIVLQTAKVGKLALISVKDNGAGITEEVRARVFEPFFTTKPDRGTGLGLSVAHRIILNHDGEIGVESRPGEGTTFTIRLPVSGVSAKDAKQSEITDSQMQLSILVVDDEKEVGSVLNELLSDEGHRVMVADDGSKAISMLKKDQFDVVITDLGMRGVTGWDVASAAKRVEPALPVIMLTGWVDSVRGEGPERRTVDMVLSKPAKRDELVRAITQVVSQKGMPSGKVSVETGPVIAPPGGEEG
jgi:CheY-like chemotaxis protein